MKKVDIGFAGALEQSRQWLQATLRDGPQLRATLVAAAEGQGYNEKNIEKAAAQLGVLSEKVQTPQGIRAQWRLVDAAPQQQPVLEPEPQGLEAQLGRIREMQQLVAVYRFEGDDAQYLDSLPGADIDLRIIKRRFGGGRFRVLGQVFTIAGPPLEAQVPGAPAVAAKPFQRADGSSSGGVDVMALLVAMIQQQGQVMTAMLTRQGQGQQFSPVELFKAMDDAIARRTASAPAVPATPMDQALALLEKGINLGRTAAEGEEPGSRATETAIRAVAPFLNAMAARVAASAQPPAAGPVAVIAAPDEPAREAGLPVNAIQRVMADLGPAIPQLLEEAKKGTPAKAVAQYIHDNADENQYDALAEAAEDPQFVDQLLEQIVRRTTNAGWAVDWLRSAVKAMHELLLEDRRNDGTGADDAGAGAGDTGASSAAAPDRRG